MSIYCLVDNNPPLTSFTHLIEKKLRKIVQHVTHDRWHKTSDMWHKKRDRWGEVNLLFWLAVNVFWRFWGKKSIRGLINELQRCLQLFWARIKDIKAILRYKNFKSADPTQFWRYNQNKNCFETSIAKGSIYGGVQDWILTFVTIFLELFYIVSQKSLILYMKKISLHFCTPLISNFMVCWFQNSFCFCFIFKTELGPHFWSFCTSKWP